MSEAKLVPCPFCGGEGKLVFARLFDGSTPCWHIQCKNQPAHRAAGGCYNSAPGRNGNSKKCDRCYKDKVPCAIAVDEWNNPRQVENKGLQQ